METLFENGQIRVYKNPSDEIFILLKSNDIVVRISDAHLHPKHYLLFRGSYLSVFEPMDNGFKVSARSK